MRAGTDHAWVYGIRWPQCSRCGARGHWIDASIACPGTPRKEDEIGIDVAISRIRSDLEAFRVWWLDRTEGLGISRPTLAEWRAEFLEWSRANGASAAP